MTERGPAFDDLVRRAAALVRPGRRALLGIAGSPGSGKTTLAERLVRRLDEDGSFRVAHVPMDGFHLADAELDRLGRRDRKGAPDTFDAAGYAALLRRLREDEEDLVYAPGFERVLEQPLAGALPVPRAARLIVTEGNYLLLREDAWARARSQLDEVWFCEPDEADRVRRLVARHEEFGKDHDTAVAWVLGTDQRNAELVAATRNRADLVVGPTVVGTTTTGEGAAGGAVAGRAITWEAVAERGVAGEAVIGQAVGEAGSPVRDAQRISPSSRRSSHPRPGSRGGRVGR